MDIVLLDYERAQLNDADDGDPELPARLPNLEALQPGDLILSTPRKWDLGTPFIKLGQRIRYSWDDARWNHASLYAGPGYRIIHTNPDHGVAESDLESMVKTHLLRFRRDPEMEPGAGRRMVDAAQDLLGLNYSKYGFAKATLDQFMKMGYRSRRDKPQLICSTLYVDAYEKANPGKRLFTQDSRYPIPALLSRTPLLSDVAVSWKRVR